MANLTLLLLLTFLLNTLVACSPQESAEVLPTPPKGGEPVSKRLSSEWISENGMAYLDFRGLAIGVPKETTIISETGHACDCLVNLLGDSNSGFMGVADCLSPHYQPQCDLLETELEFYSYEREGSTLRVCRDNLCTLFY